MDRHSTEISVSARYSEMPDLMDQLARQGAAQGGSEADLQRLQLVAEELFTNSIRHGYGAECASPVTAAVSRGAHGLRLRYCDRAPLFDLTAYAPEETPAIGGLGIPLIRGMSKAVRYLRQDGLNITELDF